MKKILGIAVLLFIVLIGGMTIFYLARYGTPEKINTSLLDEPYRMIKLKHLNQPIPDTLLVYGAIDGIVGAINDTGLVFIRPDKIRKNAEIKSVIDSEKLGPKDIAAAINIIRSFYPQDSLVDSLLIRAAICGMVKNLNNPFFNYLAPEEISVLKEQPKETVGLGVQLIADSLNRIFVIQVISESPAEKAGLYVGDEIIAIDGQRVVDRAQAHNLLKGKEGQPVKLTINRNGIKQEITVMRGKFKNCAVNYRMIGDLAYIEIQSFSLGVSEDFRSAIEQILKNKPKGIILDLRDNPGGLGMEALAIANYWTGRKIIQKEKSARGHCYDLRPPYFNHKMRPRIFPVIPPLRDAPTVVLVNGYSASASEVLTGALKYYGLATIVGEKTFGKGVGQVTKSLQAGGILVVTSFYWFLPDGQSIHKIGIMPDVEVKLTLEDKIKGRDPQLERAKELLQR